MTKTAYVLGKQIARGGMAEIHLGKAVGEDEFQRVVAIKRILPHHAEDKEFLSMFRNEAHICKRLQHENIVKVYDFTEVEGSYALIMEYINGADLRSTLAACEQEKIRMPVDIAIYIAACAARGLHYAHTKTDEVSGQPLGIIHRDISPQNILMSFEGEVKITDFGIAFAESKMTETRAGVVKGKYSYMSPEQIAAKQLDPRTDVFSLAIVLWECLSMKRLFTGSSDVETISKVQACDIPLKLTDLNKGVDADLMAMVHRGLAKEPKKRYQTAQEFEKTLLKYLHTKFPDFSSSELGEFLKNVLKSKKAKTEGDIRETLTKTGYRSPNTTTASSLLSKPGTQADNQSPPIAHTSIKSTTGLSPLPLSGAAEPLKMAKTGNQMPMSSAPLSNASPIPLSSAQPLSKAAPAASPASAPAATYPDGPAQFPKAGPMGAANAKPTGGGKSASGRNRTVIIPVAVILGALAYFIFGTQEPVNSKSRVELHALPNTVIIGLNGKRLKNGAHLKTPIAFDIPAGRYQLSIERAGYLTETVQLEAGSGDVLKPETIVLKQDPAARFISMRITAPGRRMQVSVDNDLAKGPTPLLAKDLKSDLTHTINFWPLDSKDKKAFKCSVKASALDANVLVEIQSTRDGRFRCVSK